VIENLAAAIESIKHKKLIHPLHEDQFSQGAYGLAGQSMTGNFTL